MQSTMIAERPLGYVQVTGIGAATPLTIPDGCQLAVVAVEAQAVRWRDDGVAPTASVGMPLAAGSVTNFTTQGLAQLRFIEQTAGAILNVTFYG